MQYIYEEQYYIDLYDLLTIKDCLRCIYYWRNAYQDKKKEQGVDQKTLLDACTKAMSYDLYIRKTENFRQKKVTIDQWIKRDQKEQDLYDNTLSPNEIYCPSCGDQMICTDKTLEDHLNTPARILFFFECSFCKKRRGIYENGEERISKPQLCSKCRKPVKVKYSENVNLVTRTVTCPSCKFTEQEVDDFAEWKAKRDKEKQQERELLEKYRSEFCLTDSEGKNYIEGLENLKRLSDLLEKWQKEKEDPNYQKAMKLKKLTVLELEQLLAETLGKEKYIKLSFDRPEIARDVKVPFTIQDADSSRKEYESIHTLQKLIKIALDGTNWHLMSEGTSYRLGYLSGRFRGVEVKEDLTELASSSQKENFIY